ncbi:hypothetical protein F5876DRAFT_70844 [Lentinula aff. lateritia]|uniref:Uncharacterized protein n=1 Tax=Lentinula aff. lateritia TaxID=2804960 RepID=A0ACC1THU2_9AGAR|nr:hypothetical protein F5876DRAFT_70844 [Lentinula aff. lateritia]
MKGFQTYPSLARENRARKTHRTDEISALFKKMDIGLKLKLNFKIDKENRKRREKSLEFQLGNSAEDASDIASFVTIDTISLNNVRKDPTTFERLKDFLTTDTLDFFRQRNEEEEGDRRSRTRGREEEAEEAKISHIEGKPHVLDLKEMAKWVKEAGGIFRDEDLDFIQWSQAAKNFYQFECLRDEDLGKEAPRPLFYVEHFAFFLNQQDSEDFFAYWLKVEVKLRKEHQSKLYAFDSDTYEREWTLVRAERISDAKYTTSSSAPPPTQPLPSKTTSSSTSQKPFPTGSKERTAAPCCLRCAARGHKLDGHDDTKNGPFRWARNVKGLISTPAGKNICWYWNLRGQCRGCDKEHCCTFCGSTSHYAFKWECTAQPPIV